MGISLAGFWIFCKQLSQSNVTFASIQKHVALASFADLDEVECVDGRDPLRLGLP